MTTTATPYTVPSNVSSNVPSAHTSQRSMRMLLLALILTALQGCTTTSGIVVDEQGKPLKGAIVMAQWSRDPVNPVVRLVLPLPSAPSVCDWAEVTYTDDDGRFRTPSGKGRAATYSPQVDVVYPGRYPGKGTDIEAKRFVMLPFEGLPEKSQFHVAWSGVRGGGCGNDLVILPYSKLRVANMEKYAVTDSDKKQLESSRYGIEIVEFGQDEAQRRYISRASTRQETGKK